MYYSKVEICGVNTAKLKVLKEKEKAELLKESILQMDYPYRQVTLLQYYNEMSSREIAETLGLSPDNVRQIARRAREQLKKKLTETGYFQ